ncbi:MAG: FAD-dependent oxidoreductase [Thermoplasmata archaeon]
MIGILGGGLAGLSAAHRLRRLGRPDFIVIEKEAEPGGLCRSWRLGDFLFDYGPHIIYTRDACAMRLFRRFLRGNLKRMRRENFIQLYGKLIRYPFEAFLHGLPPGVILECLEGVIKARERREFRRPSNLMEWAIATFGEGIARHYFIPYNLKVWKYPLERIGVDWIEGRVPTPDLRDMIRGALGLQDRDFGPNAIFHYPVRGGIGSLPMSMASGLQRLSLGSVVELISPSSRGIRVRCRSGGREETLEFSKVISTLALPTLVPLIESAPAEVRRAARRLVYTRLVCVGIGLKRKAVSDKHSIYFPEKDFLFNRISFPMNLAPSMGPRGRSSILVELTIPSHGRVRPRRTLDRVVADLKRTGVLRERDELDCAEVRSYDFGYVVHDLEHGKNVRVIHDYLRSAGIFPAGRFGEWKYLNMDMAMLSGARAADEAVTRKTPAT